MENETNPNPASPLTSRNVLELLAVAHDFTRFLEKAEEAPKESLVRYLQRVLPLIYLKSSLLPEIAVTDEDAIEHYVTEEQWQSLFNTLRSKFETEDEYLYVANPAEFEEEPLRGSLSENITDLYQDLKDFVLLYQNPLTAFRENAVREVRHLFETRYGYRLVNALKALHYLVYPEISVNHEDL
jgi:hypothetical protein